MENLNIWKFIVLIIITVGILCIYDARKLAQRFFSKSDTNSITKKFKIIGFIISIIGSTIILL